MKIGIVGDREVSESDFKLIESAVAASGFKISKVISGGAKGADTLAVSWAKKNKIKFKEYPADWKNLDAPGAIIKEGAYGKYNAAAGFQRNQTIVDESDAIIALQPMGKTDGTSDTISKAVKKGIPVFIWPPQKDQPHSYTF